MENTRHLRLIGDQRQVIQAITMIGRDLAMDVPQSQRCLPWKIMENDGKMVGQS